MAEEGGQEQKAKKPGKFRRVGRWVFVVAAALLLAGALWFRMPWKIPAVLATFVVACGFLPLSGRRWFWRGVLVVAVVPAVWVFLPVQTQGWQVYQFDEELAQLQERRAVGDEQNAAIIYKELIARYEPNGLAPDFLDDEAEDRTRRREWKSEDYPELSEWLDERGELIEKLVETTRMEKCRFQIPADLVAFDDHTSPMRSWTFVLVRAGNRDIGEGRVEEGLEKFFACLRLGGHLYQQATMIEYLLGLSIEAVGHKALERFIVEGPATDERLDMIEETLQRPMRDWSEDFLRMLKVEKLQMKNLWAMMLFEVNEQGRVRLSRDPMSAAEARFNLETLEPGYWGRRLLRVKVIAQWFFAPSSPKKLSRIIDRAYSPLEEFAGRVDAGPVEQKDREFSLWNAELNYPMIAELLVRIVEPAYHKLHEIHLRTEAERRAGLVMVALRRYKNAQGNWPERLGEIEQWAGAEALVDPVTGGEFVYKTGEEGFSLYSKGTDGIDEGGRHKVTFDPNEPTKRQVEADDIRFWPEEREKQRRSSDSALPWQDQRPEEMDG